MIRVETYLFDSFERGIFGQAIDIIEQHRRKQQEARHGYAEPGQRVPDQGEPEAPPAGTEQVVAAITPAGAVKAAPGGLTAPEVTEAVQASIRAIGIPATRAILQSFGSGQVMKIEKEKWPAVLEALADAAKRRVAE